MTALASKLPALALPAAAREHWRAALMVAAMLVLFGFAASGLVLNGSGRGFDSPAERDSDPAVQQIRAVAARTSATQLKAIAPQDALLWNAAVPVSNLANPAARPFILNAASEADRLRSIDCLTAALYYEAAREPVDGQRAVAQVVLNRVRHPAWPSTVCGVVFEGARRYTGCQFSFSCDGSLRRGPIPELWNRLRRVAEAALSGYVYAPVGWSTHYHANYVVPYWASSLVKAHTIGAHIFYRWRGGWGRPPAFVSRHGGAEPAIQWRGGFGQPSMAERMAAAEAGERDAAAAEAAEGALPIGSVDSFQRAVLRRYEAPLNRERAGELIDERVRSRGDLTNSQRWALTGSDSGAETVRQRPLGRWGTEPAEPGPVTAPPPAADRTASAAPAEAPPAGTR